MWSKALVSSPPGSWHWSLGECSRSLMIWNRCCTRYNVVCTCHKLDLDSWIPSPTAGCTLIPWSQVTLIRTSQVSPWIVQLAPISWPHICLGHFVFRTWFTWQLGWLLVFMSSAKAPFWQTIWSTHGHPERKATFFVNRPPHLLYLDFHLFCTSFFHYSPA